MWVRHMVPGVIRPEVLVLNQNRIIPSLVIDARELDMLPKRVVLHMYDYDWSKVVRRFAAYTFSSPERVYS